MSFYLFRKLIRRLPGIVIKAVPLPEPKLDAGFGARNQIGEICRSRGYRSALLVTDTTLASLGFHEVILRSMEQAGIPCTVFSGISSEPTVDIVRAGREAAVRCKADCVIALGGGSVMDSSKVIAASAKKPGRRLGRYLTKFVLVRGKTLPMITVPSTAGTGAEMTVGAVVKNSRGVKKASVIVGLNVHDVILDSELTLAAPRGVTVGCGIDALSHGLEGCLADVRVSETDREKSLQCVRIVFEDLPKLLENPGDIDARQRMCLAANDGGNAINKQLAGYVHAFAHTLGGAYHISHGEAIARCLLPVVRFHRGRCAAKLAELAVYCGFAGAEDPVSEAAERFIAALRELLLTCGFTGGFDRLRPEDYKSLTKKINADSINYSPPKTLTNREISQLLDEIRRGIQ